MYVFHTGQCAAFASHCIGIVNDLIDVWVLQMAHAKEVTVSGARPIRSF